MTQITVKHKGKDVVLTPTPEQLAVLKAAEDLTFDKSDEWADIIKKANPDADELQLLNYKGESPRMLATKGELMLKILCDVMNEGWVWQPGEYGWLPWFNLSDGGFAFSDSSYGGWYSYSDVGSRRCFKTEKLADLAAEKFPEVFKLIILIQ